MKKLVGFMVLLAIAAGFAWVAAGRAAGPVIDITSPGAAIGRASELDVAIDAPGGRLNALSVVLEQGTSRVPIATLSGAELAQLPRQGKDRVLLTRPIGKQQVPQLVEGKAQIIVTASRPVLFGLRQIPATTSREVAVRLTPPILSVVSRYHYINQGGSEMVVYHVSPADAASGVRVGSYEYRGYPASGAHIANADPGLKVAFFALLWNQDPSTPISLYARDDVGNEAHASFDYRVIPKKFRQSRIPIDDRFLEKVVPPILEHAPQLKVADPSNLLAAFLRINGELRREDTARIAALASSSAPEILWQGPFKQLVNTAVEAGFADQRTYVYKGEVVDHQVHLGYDLASFAGAPIYASNRGRVVHAGWLDIFGNCVILDHGMGLQSLYGHMSSIAVKLGEMVSQGAVLGRTGSTGLAGGDHLHFTMLLGGNAITPIDWWSAKWVQDRILRKLSEAGAAGAQPQQSATR
ncbi:MAG TPA: M23 family metallopeptidase [Steroidobacteraceae bacterium]|nr:M23 family metallopeptidase [Steroidobacteraceae bacterium]